jgi:hypothetical protein
MPDNTVLLEIEDGIALLTLNRPERLNALSYALIDRLMAQLDLIEVEPTVRAVILTGARGRAPSPPVPTSTNFPAASRRARMWRSAISCGAARR